MDSVSFHADGRTDMKKLIVPFCNFANAPKTFQYMLYREKVDVCSEIRKQHINTFLLHNVELLNVSSGGTYGNHWTFESLN